LLSWSRVMVSCMKGRVMVLLHGVSEIFVQRLTEGITYAIDE